MTKCLIVNADDYGRTPGVSLGIRLAHLQGIVTSTSAMMNMPAAADGLRRAQRECPRLGLGVHLVLTSGRPLTPPERVPSLVLSSGRFPAPDEAVMRLSERGTGGEGLHLDEVEMEWRAQIEKFVEVVGRAPDHLDSHHHFSYATPALFGLMLALAKEYDVPIRNPFGRSPDQLTGLEEELVLPRLAGFYDLIQTWRPRSPDRFLADFYDETANIDQILRVIASLPEGVSELMCHPAVPDAALLDPVTGSPYNLRRAEELAVLTAPELREALSQKGVELMNYSGL